MDKTVEKIITDGQVFVKGHFNKHFENEDYTLDFNTRTGMEVLNGKHGDPFMTELPTMIDIGIMGSCQNNCEFCYQGPDNEPHMSLDNFKSIILQTKHHINQVALGGRGDPNLHPQFAEIIEFARKHDVVPNYTTSGKNITTDQIEISKMCGAVAVSYYASGFTFSALNRLMLAGIKTNIHYMFTQFSQPFAMTLLRGSEWPSVDTDRLNAVIFLLFKPQGSGRDLTVLIPTPDQLKMFAEEVFNPKSKFKIGMDSCMINHVVKYVTPHKIQAMSIDTCEAARMSVYISPSMKMIPCSFADHDSCGVQIDDVNDIKTIWTKHPNFKKWRGKLAGEPCCPVGF